jgi:hypothetical protein
MRLFLLIAVVSAGALWLRRNPSARTWIVSMARAGAMHVNLVAPDYGTLQQQVLYGARRRRCVAVNGVVRLPSEYQVTFDDRDRALVEPVEDAFFADVIEVLVADAEARQWLVDRRPRFRATYIDHGRPGFPLVAAVKATARRALVPPSGVGEETQAFDPGPATEAASPGAVTGSLRLRELGTDRVICLADCRESTTVGRGPTSDVLVDHPAVSVRHARLSCRSAGWAVVDDGSRNGTYVNDVAAATLTPIEPGDVVRFGPDMAFVVED